jgi:putative ABC transport system permease protein
MFDIALRNLRARRTRSILSVTAVLVCVFLVGTVDGMLAQMQTGMAADLARYMGKILIQQPGSGYPPFGSILSLAAADQIITKYSAQLDTNESTSVVLLALERAESPMDVASVIGFGITPGREKGFIGNTQAAEGSTTLSGHVDGAIVLGSEAARRYHASVGTELAIRNTPFTIVGILEHSGVKNIDTAVLMKLEAAQRLSGRSGSVSAVLLTAKDINMVTDLSEQLSREFPEFDVITQKDLLKNAEKMMEMPNRFMGMISLTVLMVAVLVVMNVMMIAVTERTREIGILRAIGAKKYVVLEMIVLEASILSLIGGVLGALVVVPAAYIMDWTRVLSVQETVKVSLLVVAVAVLAGIYPAYRATRISPIEALRNE